MNQRIIDRAVNIATKSALNGHPVERIIWIPPMRATQDPGGAFAIKYADGFSASVTPPWEK